MTRTEATTKRIGVRLRVDQAEWVEGEAARRRAPASAVVRDAIEGFRAGPKRRGRVDEPTDPATARQIVVRVYADQAAWVEEAGGAAAVREAIDAAMREKRR